MSDPAGVMTRRAGAHDLRFLAIALGVAAGYFATAKLGLRLAVVAEQVTAVWPPTGIALTAVLLLGDRIAPAIWLGAFLANATAHEPLATAAGIATGNTLEAVVGAWLLQRVVGMGQSVDRLRDALGLIVFGALASPTISATIGVTSLALGGVQPWTSFWSIWVVWWLGDAMGALVVAPVLLALVAGWRRRWPAARLAEAGGGLAALGLIGLLVFTGVLGRAASSHPLEYTIFPFLMWAALRFGQIGTATVTAVASAIAVWGTMRGSGPFATGDLNDSLILLQVFLGVVAMSGLVLAAAIHERDVAERRRAADYAVTHALADSASLTEAAPRILRAVGGSLEWPVGALWTVDQGIGALRCTVVWVAARRSFPEFEAATRQRTFGPGVGLPGRVWADGRAVWILDVVPDANFPRAPIAAREGLHGAFAFPIVLGGRTWGVIEFFSRRIERPDVRPARDDDGHRQPDRPVHRAQASGGRARRLARARAGGTRRGRGGQPREGRVPGDAGARAPQSAGRDHQRHRRPRAGRVARRGGRARARDHPAASEPPRPTGQRSPRRGAGHLRQDPPATTAGST